MVDELCRRTGSDPYPEHPWVLVTGVDDEETRRLTRRWTDRGHEVFVCTGPLDGHSCPLIEGEACPVADCAQVVLNRLDTSVSEVQVLLDNLMRHYPDLPVMSL